MPPTTVDKWTDSDLEASGHRRRPPHQASHGTAPYIEDFDSQGDLAIPPHNCAVALNHNHHHHNQHHPQTPIDNYEMPKSYPPFVTRSPLRTRANPSAAAAARFGGEAPPLLLRSPMNFVDQIREPPPGYRVTVAAGGVQPMPLPPHVTVTRVGSMPRTKSHDRIAQRRQQQQQQLGGGKQRLRPRSYCSNIVSDSFMNA